MNKYLKFDYSTVEFFYSHWDEDSQDINFENEIKRLSQFIKDNKITNYSIIAKSAGFVLSLQGMCQNMLTPLTIVGYGLPIEYSIYRKINLKSLIYTASRKTNIICIQADQDPQWNLKHVEYLISDIIPVWCIKDNTHNYDKFKQMTNIAKAFVATHQPQIEHRIEKIDIESIWDAVKIVKQFPKKFRFKNNWIFDIEKKIYIFSFKNKNIIIKQGNINKLKKEVENASKVNQLIDKIKIGSKELIAIVPDFYNINSQKGYLISEYCGPDCNELFYQHVNKSLSTNEIIQILKQLNKASILHKNLLPRNVIVKNNKIYLIDFENVIFNKNSANKTLQFKTSILVGWRNLTKITEKEIEANIYYWSDAEQNVEYLNKYEDTFKNMLGLTNTDNYQTQKLCYENIINATSYKNQLSLLKLDDILHSISGILPIEVELLIDFLLCEEYNQGSLYLYSNLSNIIKIARIKSFMEINTRQIKSFICNQIKDMILKKITKENNKLWVRESIIKIIKNRDPKYKPLNDYLIKVENFLLV